jgi:hypothetical protein
MEKNDDRWLFSGVRRRDNGAGSIVISRLDLSRTPVTDLRRAMLRAGRQELMPDQVLVAVDGLEEFDEDYVPVEPVAFEVLSDGRFAVRVQIDIPADVDPFDAMPAVSRAVRPYLDRCRAAILEEKPAYPWATESLLLSTPTRGRTLLELFMIGEGVYLLASALLSRRPDRTTLRDLVLAGHADLVIGQPENEWFDAKTDHYLYGRGEEGKVKLARAVAQFCNGEEGGVVVVGMKTTKAPGRVDERVAKLTPVPITGSTVRQYRDALEKHLFPFPEGLTIEAVPATGIVGRGYVMIALPPQPEEMKPYLVHGAFVSGRVEGSYFTIVRRSGEDGLPVHAAQVHNLLVTGRALLRHGLAPASTELQPAELASTRSGTATTSESQRPRCTLRTLKDR